VKLLQDPCIGLVGQIEKGDVDGPETRSLLEKVLQPMMAQHIDTVVLGCTHYPFVIPLIQKIVGPEVRVIDPAPAVARQIKHRLEEYGWLAESGEKASVIYFSSGDPQQMQCLLPPFIGEQGVVRKAEWLDGKLIVR
jgi:glutamate racemase